MTIEIRFGLDGDERPLEALRYEEAFGLLEETLEEMRSDGLALDRALVLYERGTALAAHCDRLLAQADLRVSTLTSSSFQSSVVPSRDPNVGDDGAW